MEDKQVIPPVNPVAVTLKVTLSSRSLETAYALVKSAEAIEGVLSAHIEEFFVEQESFEKDLAQIINRRSLENGSGTPDFLLAAYLQGCLDLWNKTTVERDRWHGFESSLAAAQLQSP